MLCLILWNNNLQKKFKRLHSCVLFCRNRCRRVLLNSSEILRRF